MKRYGEKGKTKDLVYKIVAGDPKDSCIFWEYGRDGQGYARALVPGFASRLAHRIICEIINGPPPVPEYYARHICGNGHLGCVNPGHLEWGSAQDNQDDELKLGRRKYGEETTKAVLNEAAIREIRNMRTKGLSYQKIGDKFGVQRSTIQAVAEGRTWAHVV
jgi:hypothetical protein